MSSTNRGAKRAEKDAYPTPASATEAICNQLIWPNPCDFLEPCIGDGAISSVVSAHATKTYGRYSMMKMHWCEIAQGRDFLTHDWSGKRFDIILTNPPFTWAKEFIEKSLSLANCVIMLLPLSFMGSDKRKEWWQSRKPTAIHVLSHRPSFTGDGKTDSAVYAWFVWDSTGRQKSGLYWL